MRYTSLMGVPLFQLVVQQMKDPAGFEGTLKTPALVWEGPPVRDAPDDAASPFDSMPTVIGRNDQAVRSGEVRVYFVKKDPRIANPFSMGVTVGRLATNDLVLDDASVSRFHAFLQQDPKTSQWVVTDVGSDNGTFVEGQRLEPKAGRPLVDGARVAFGGAALVFMLPASLARYVAKKSAAP